MLKPMGKKETSMKLVLPGGSGHLGTMLAQAFHGQGHEVAVLSRSPREEPWRTVFWDGETQGPWVAELEGADVVINLAGRSVDCRYSASNRRSILDSRVLSTRAVGQALGAVRRPPGVWLQMSTATIYSHRFDAPNDEEMGRIGGGERGAPNTWKYSIEVAKAWEREVDEAKLSGIRRIKLRSAVVMNPSRGGAFDILLGLVRRGLGGEAGSGRQYVSWIHGVDFVRAIGWLIEGDVEGVVNLAAPNPLPNTPFMRALRSAWGISFGLPAPRWLLEVGALFLRTETELILKSRRVVPGVLDREGFEFRYPDWPQAARDLCQRWKDDNLLRGAR